MDFLELTEWTICHSSEDKVHLAI